MLSLYKGLVLSQLLYAFPLLSLATSQWEALETFQRVALRVCLELPRYSDNAAVLGNAQELVLQHQFQVRALRHTERFHNSYYSIFLLEALLNCLNSQMGLFATIFAADLGDPCSFPPLAPYP